MLVLQNVNKIERRARIRASVTKQLEANPELKEAYRKLVKNLPAEQQERVMMSIAAHHYAASATKPGRASLAKRAAKREDSWLAPAACACAHPETSRSFSQAKMPQLRRRISARLSAGYLSKPRVSAALLPTRPTEKNIIASNRRRVHGEMCYRKE
jgi:hypothetical protein